MRTLNRCMLIFVLNLVSTSQAIEIPLSVVEPAGIARRSEPVSGGISLPAGTFKPGTVELALYEGDNQIPLQVTELVVGPKGFVRWVLVDFQVDIEAGQTKKLILKTGSAIAPKQRLKVVETETNVKIDTGRIAFDVPKNKPFGLVENVTAGGKSVISKGQISYIDGLADKRYTADIPDVLNIHYAGPMRVTIEVRGKFAGDQTGKLRYCTYITAWAGRNDILVRHSLINSRSDRFFMTKVKSSCVELKPAAAHNKITIGADKRIETSGGGRTVLHQGLEEQRNRQLPSARLTRADETIWQGRDAQGWISAGPVWVADRLFSTDPPRSLGISDDGAIVLEAAPKLFDGQRQQNGILGRPYGSQDEHRWLYDCSQHSSEYRIDFAAPQDAGALTTKAASASARLWAFAPGAWYSRCGVLGVGRFGTLDDEKACHAEWQWPAYQEPDLKANPTRFVAWEDNHYESEADSAEGLLLQFLRIGKRGFFDEAEAWVRYHTDLQTWRTEGWLWKDGGIWFPQGGPPGNRPVREKRNIQYQNWNKGTDTDRTLWRLAMAKSCYCHFYGAGLVDWFCLTGDREALLAAIDNCETKWDEFTHFRDFQPGKSHIASTRGFGRGFYVAVRTWMVQPKNEVLKELIQLCRDTFVNLPGEFLDERGVYAVTANKHPDKYLTGGIKKFMAEQGITVDKSGTFKDKAGSEWKWRDVGGTWMIAYIQHACNLLAENSEDEDLMDYVIASGEFTAKYMQSPVARQTWYYTALDIPQKGDIWDQWKYDGLQRNEFGEGPKHSGWYTRFFPDCCARAYSWTGEPQLLEKAKELWSFGNRRRYQTTNLTEKHNFADHHPPKDDSVLSTVRLFYESSHPRADTESPAAIKDLTVQRVGDGKARIRFTAPTDKDGKVAKYQVKVADLPILPYEEWDYSRDSGQKRNWWRAMNCTGEPNPKAAGQKEDFTVTNVPEISDRPLFFAVRTFDDSGNRSAISNVSRLE